MPYRPSPAPSSAAVSESSRAATAADPASSSAGFQTVPLSRVSSSTCAAEATDSEVVSSSEPTR
eukprot:scaffold49804_cov58-Phaeocystis_antarctica.AAC.3